MTGRSPVVIRSCCCKHHLVASDKSAPSASSAILGLSSRASRYSEININQLDYRPKPRPKSDDLNSQTETLVANSSNAPSMDGDAEPVSNRHFHVITNGNVVQGCNGIGCAVRKDRTLVKNRRSESCFDLIGDSRYAGHLENERATPTHRWAVSGSMSTSRDSSSSGMFRSHSQRTPLHYRQTCSKNHENNKLVTAYLTPLQRKERELKQIKKEIAKLVDEIDERDSIILSLKYEVESEARSFKDETERKIEELEQALRDSRKEKAEKVDENKTMKSQLEAAESKLEKIKLEQEKEKEQFKDKYLDMYIKGQRAAAFEREEELEMLSSKRKEKVTARELARKLSRTESELAKWQTMRLDEAYHIPSKPESSCEVTLNFLKDSFYHFITDPLNCLHHFRAMVEIFKYSEEQMKVIRKSIAESTELKKILKRNN